MWCDAGLDDSSGQGKEDIDPNRPDKHGSTLLCHGARRGHGGIVKLLCAQKSVGNADAQGSHAP